MVVIIRIEVDDVTRRAIRRSMGMPGLATRAEVTGGVECAFETSIVDIVHDEEQIRAARKPRAARAQGRR